MKITNVHMNSPIELRFTILDGERQQVRMIFPPKNATPVRIGEMIADNLNRYFEDKAAGFPYDFNAEAHIAGILADAPRYGCD